MKTSVRGRTAVSSALVHRSGARAVQDHRVALRAEPTDDRIERTTGADGAARAVPASPRAADASVPAASDVRRIFVMLYLFYCRTFL